MKSRDQQAPEPLTAERLEVWTVLSELFLDTELSDGDLRRIAANLRESPYAPAEIGRILRSEVMPAFGANLASVAGEWTPWSEDEVRAIMTRSLHGNRIARWFAAFFAWRMIREDWRRIEAMLE
uniref:DUF7079 family protein n=1 Tax=Castellaniella defragrans TaxID=75697 RepID=UPI00333F4603